MSVIRTIERPGWTLLERSNDGPARSDATFSPTTGHLRVSRWVVAALGDRLVRVVVDPRRRRFALIPGAAAEARSLYVEGTKARLGVAGLGQALLLSTSRPTRFDGEARGTTVVFSVRGGDGGATS